MKAEHTPGDDIVIVCAQEEEPHHSASRVVNAGCGHRVWLAPSSEPAFAAGGRLICWECLPSGAIKPDDELRIAPGSDCELAEYVGVARADQLMAALRDFGFKTVEPERRD